MGSVSLSAGGVTGGVGGIGGALPTDLDGYSLSPVPSGNGQAFASGIFLQGAGDTRLTFTTTTASGAAGTQTISDVIGDTQGAVSQDSSVGLVVYGAGVFGTVNLSNLYDQVGIAVGGTGTLVLQAVNTFSGGITFSGGTLELARAGSAGRGAIAFVAPLSGTTETLSLDAGAQPVGATFANTLTNFALAGEALDLKGFSVSQGTYAASGGTLTLNGQIGGHSASETFNLVGGADTYTATPDADGGTLITVASARALSITGGTANQATTQGATVQGVFAGVTIADAQAGAPTETVSITLGGAGGTLGEAAAPSGQTNTLQGGGTSYSVNGTVAQVNAELARLSFTPAATQPNTASTTTFTLADTSSGGGAVIDTTPSVVNSNPASAPTVTGGKANQSITSEAVAAGAAVANVFAGVTVADANAGTPTETVSIALGGTGGTLSEGSAPAGSTNTLQGTGTIYTVNGTVAAVNAELARLSFTPTAGQPSKTSTTTFSLAASSSIGGPSSAADSTPSVTVL